MTGCTHITFHDQAKGLPPFEIFKKKVWLDFEDEFLGNFKPHFILVILVILVFLVVFLSKK